ncbi:acyl carrier protein [Dactylosporangium roseum]|uniref:Acyl carrier protein n=1 Tax=Dactylosporangium roseum TaxID=47989 RepID=A0ABY5YXU5_9ACTN|nr:acyl carrier protein [Dactylosporangium roseum]UWZ34352.1 acyl carrier protein [Dactylosporangium roseum]
MIVTVEDVRRILIACSGAPEVEVADADFADTSLEDLGYDSLALMESAATIEQEYGVRVSDETFAAAKTPRELTEIVESAAKAAA